MSRRWRKDWISSDEKGEEEEKNSDEKGEEEEEDHDNRRRKSRRLEREDKHGDVISVRRTWTQHIGLYISLAGSLNSKTPQK